MTAVADVCDLETTVAAVLEKANPIVRRQAADMKVRANDVEARLACELFRDDSDLEVSLGTQPAQGGGRLEPV